MLGISYFPVGLTGEQEVTVISIHDYINYLFKEICDTRLSSYHLKYLAGMAVCLSSSLSCSGIAILPSSDKISER